MGNLCSNRSLYYHYTTSIAQSTDEPAPSSVQAILQTLTQSIDQSNNQSNYQNDQPVQIPSLFDLCIHSICLSLIDEHVIEEIAKRRKNTLRLDELHSFLIQSINQSIKQSNPQLNYQANYPSLTSPSNQSNNQSTNQSFLDRPRARSLSLRNRESPELSPQTTPLLLPLNHSLSPLNNQLGSPPGNLYRASSRSLQSNIQSVNPRKYSSSVTNSPSNSILNQMQRDSLAQSVNQSINQLVSPLSLTRTIPLTFAQSLPSSVNHTDNHEVFDELTSPPGQQRNQSISQTVSQTINQTIDMETRRSVSGMLGLKRRKSWFAGKREIPPAYQSISQPINHSVTPSIVQPPRLSTLPESLLQLVFDRLIDQRLLTARSLSLFSRANLQSINLANYPNVDDTWLFALLGSNNQSNNQVGNSFDVPQMMLPASHSFNQSVLVDQPIDEDDSDEEILHSSSPTTPVKELVIHPSVHSTFDEEKNDNVSSINISLSQTNNRIHPSPLRISPSIKPLPSQLHPLAHSLINQSNLTYLNLSNCDRLSALSLLMIGSPVLRRLNLSGCTQLSDEVLLVIIQSCSHPSNQLNGQLINQLMELNLNGCRALTDLSVSQVIKMCGHLRSLSLDSTSITDAGICSLSQLTNLRHFSCAYNKAIDLSNNQSIDLLTKLRSLNLSHTSVHDMELYIGCHALKKLNVSGTKMRRSSNHVVNNSIYPHLSELIMQRCSVRELPLMLMTRSLVRLDCSFCKSIKQSTFISQFTQFLESINQPSNQPISQLDTTDVMSDDDEFDEEDSKPRSRFSSIDQSTTPVSQTVPDNQSNTQTSNHLFNQSTNNPNHLSNNVFNNRLSASAPLFPMSSSNRAQPPLLSLLASNSFSSTQPSAQPSHPLLQSLKLEGCLVPNALLAMLPAFPCLTELDLSDTEVDSEGVQAVGRSQRPVNQTNGQSNNQSNNQVVNPFPALIDLKLSGCKLTNSCLTSLSVMTSLQSLVLDCCSISDVGLACFAPLTSLTHLDLFECAVSESGLASLTVLTRLRSLELGQTRSNNASCAVLSNMHALESLNLCQNRFVTDLGLVHLAKLSKLAHVNLSNTGITTKGLHAFLSQAKSIEAVSVYGCKIKVNELTAKGISENTQIACDEGIIQVGEER